MHRLLVETGFLEQDSVVLPKEAARHLKVLRPKPGEEIELFDGQGATRVYRVVGADLTATGVVTRHPRSRTRLTLFACVTKGSRWDWTIEKAVELGVSRIVPVISDRCIVRLPADPGLYVRTARSAVPTSGGDSGRGGTPLPPAESAHVGRGGTPLPPAGGVRAEKAERWRRIAEDAARQSDAVWLPEVLAAVDFPAALELVKACDRVFVGALTTPPPPALLTAVRQSLGGLSPDDCDLGLFVGPEGDFTPAELSALLEIAVPASFGPTILRAETAAIFGLSVLAAATH